MGWDQNKKKYSILVEKPVKKNNVTDMERGR
jgi:hypothetical protein